MIFIIIPIAIAVATPEKIVFTVGCIIAGTVGVIIPAMVTVNLVQPKVIKPPVKFQIPFQPHHTQLPISVLTLKRDGGQGSQLYTKLENVPKDVPKRWNSKHTAVFNNSEGAVKRVFINSPHINPLDTHKNDEIAPKVPSKLPSPKVVTKAKMSP
jgi:hypothetical protein